MLGRMADWTLLLPLCGLLAVAVAAVPQLPHEYHVTGTIYLPKADIVEPYEAWVDPDKGMSRIDYYNGKLASLVCHVVDLNHVMYSPVLW